MGVTTTGGSKAESPAAGGQGGVVGGAPNAAAIFPVFFPEIEAFFYIFWSKFLLKNVFLKDCKVC